MSAICLTTYQAALFGMLLEYYGARQCNATEISPHWTNVMDGERERSSAYHSVDGTWIPIVSLVIVWRDARSRCPQPAPSVRVLSHTDNYRVENASRTGPYIHVASTPTAPR